MRPIGMCLTKQEFQATALWWLHGKQTLQVCRVHTDPGHTADVPGHTLLSNEYTLLIIPLCGASSGLTANTSLRPSWMQTVFTVICDEMIMWPVGLHHDDSSPVNADCVIMGKPRPGRPLLRLCVLSSGPNFIHFFLCGFKGAKTWHKETWAAMGG